MYSYSIVYTTVSSEDEAKRIAEALLAEHLIACANAFPITSLYRWDGDLQHDRELGMICKTQTKHVKRIVEQVKKLHSYDVPCVISWQLGEGSTQFLDWIAAETEPTGE